MRLLVPPVGITFQSCISLSADIKYNSQTFMARGRVQMRTWKQRDPRSSMFIMHIRFHMLVVFPSQSFSVYFTQTLPSNRSDWLGPPPTRSRRAEISVEIHTRPLCALDSSVTPPHGVCSGSTDDYPSPPLLSEIVFLLQCSPSIQIQILPICQSSTRYLCFDLRCCSALVGGLLCTVCIHFPLSSLCFLPPPKLDIYKWAWVILKKERIGEYVRHKKSWGYMANAEYGVGLGFSRVLLKLAKGFCCWCPFYTAWGQQGLLIVTLPHLL